MTPTALHHLLDQVASGELSSNDAVDQLRDLPFQESAGALIDLHRELRQGFPEVVFGAGKTPDQIRTILIRLHAAHGAALATRVSPEAAAEILPSLPDASYDAISRLLHLGTLPARNDPRPIAVISAGTCDEPIAAEVSGTLTFLGHQVDDIRDVGVAGLHRLLAKLDQLRAASVLIVIAGMEGALPSVIGGLVAQPVIAVPTSVGYGASLNGLSALLTMLNSCASGLTVVNIDNGFGAAIAAHRIVGVKPSGDQKKRPKAKPPVVIA